MPDVVYVDLERNQSSGRTLQDGCPVFTRDAIAACVAGAVRTLETCYTSTAARHDDAGHQLAANDLLGGPTLADTLDKVVASRIPFSRIVDDVQVSVTSFESESTTPWCLNLVLPKVRSNGTQAAALGFGHLFNRHTLRDAFVQPVNRDVVVHTSIYTNTTFQW